MHGIHPVHYWDHLGVGYPGAAAAWRSAGSGGGWARMLFPPPPRAGSPGRVLGASEAAHHYSSDDKRCGISDAPGQDGPHLSHMGTIDAPKP